MRRTEPLLLLSQTESRQRKILQLLAFTTQYTRYNSFTDMKITHNLEFNRLLGICLRFVVLFHSVVCTSLQLCVFEIE
jgi:hypothetical protein